MAEGPLHHVRRLADLAAEMRKVGADALRLDAEGHITHIQLVGVQPPEQPRETLDEGNPIADAIAQREAQEQRNALALAQAQAQEERLRYAHTEGYEMGEDA